MQDLSLHLMDILQNSISAKSSKIIVSVNAGSQDDWLEIKIADNGAGMDEDLLKSVTDPFVTTRTTRKIGLGIPLFKSSAEQAGGQLELKSAIGSGTTLTAVFRISHVDRLPLGDIAETIVGVILSDPGIEYELILSNKREDFKFNTCEIKEKLGEVAITEYEVIAWIREYINEGVKITFGGVLDEIVS